MHVTVYGVSIPRESAFSSDQGFSNFFIPTPSVDAALSNNFLMYWKKLRYTIKVFPMILHVLYRGSSMTDIIYTISRSLSDYDSSDNMYI